jgi:hypothetical protein
MVYLTILNLSRSFSHDIVKTQLGDHMFDYFAEQQPDYKALNTEEAQTKYKETLFDEFMGVLILINSDQRKYG